MKREHIERLWNEAYVNGMLPFEQRECFAVLVAAHEREACARYFEERADIPFYGRHVADAIRARGEKS